MSGCDKIHTFTKKGIHSEERNAPFCAVFLLRRVTEIHRCTLAIVVDCTMQGKRNAHA